MAPPAPESPITRAGGDAPRPTQDEFREVLGRSPSGAADLLEQVHAADAASWLEDVSDEDAWQVFSSLGTEERADILEYARDGLRGALVKRLSAGELIELTEELPPDEAVDMLGDADERVTQDVLQRVPQELAEDLRELIAYPPETAGGVMTSDYLSVEAGTRVGDAIKLVRVEGDSDEEIGVFVVDDDERPVGYISDRTLLSTPIHSVVEESMVEPFTIEATADQEEAAQLLARYSLGALAVVDVEGRLVGVIAADDAVEIMAEEVREDILKLVGTAPGQREQTRMTILARVRQRLPLMGVTVLAGLTSAWFLEAFTGAEASGGTASILRYLPLIIGLSGNIGIQSSTIFVRGFATGEIAREREWSVLTSEVAVGTSIGALCGATTLVVASLLERGTWLDPFGVAVGIAVTVAALWTAILGCLIPMGCRRAGIDPAIVAGPFLVALSDVSGSVIYIVVALRLIGL